MRFVALLFLGLMLTAGMARAQETSRGWLGVNLAGLTKAEADALGWKTPRGVKVVKPLPGGPAEAAGVQAGDILWLLDGMEIETPKAFAEALAKRAAGTEIRLAIQRAGREERVAVTLGTRPARVAAAKRKVAEDAPIPMLDTGGHMSRITGIAFTPDGKFIVSAGDDKVIRIWDWRAGKTVRTILGQSGPAEAGQIYVMALSSDGRWLAAGGWMKVRGEAGHHIRLYDFASGELKGLLKGHGNVINSLAFSPDGKKLIAGAASKEAIVWDVETRTLLNRLQGHRAEIYAVGFTPDGARVVTGSYDQTLRLWSVADGALLQEMTGHGEKVRSLAISPRDGSIASGDKSGEIRFWDGETGALKKVLARQGGAVGSLSFSPDGRLLLSTCGYSGCKNTQRVYDATSGKELIAYAKHDSVVLASAFQADGSAVATAGGDNKEILIWDPNTGETKAVLKGTGRTGWAAGFAADGRGIAWGSTLGYREHNSRGPLEIALGLPGADGALAQPGPAGSAEGWVRAKASSGALSLRHRKGGDYGGDAILDLLKDGEPSGVSIERGSADGYQHRSYGFTPDGQQIVSSGGNGHLAAYGLDGKKLGDFVGHEGEVNALAPSPDGRYLVSGSADQTVRLWNLNTRELLVTIFRGTDGEWVMWTPQGYFAASPAGASLIGWQINHGAENAAEYVTAAQIRKSLNRPDIVAKAIQLASAEEAVKQSAGTKFKLADLLAMPVPRFRIVSPAAGATLAGGTAQLELALEETPDPVNLIRLYVNGVQVNARQPEDGPGFEPGPLTFSVPLAKGRNLIRAVAVNGSGETSAEFAVDSQGGGALDKRGTLRILAIGVDKYPGLGKVCRELDGVTPKSCDLSAAVSDATAFANAMAARLGPLHQGAVSTVLVNGGKSGEPKAANIVDALDELRGAQPNDTVMLFVSGHGFHEDQDYYFVPTDAEFAGGRLRKSTAVPWDRFQSVLEAANGRRFLFLDTCRSGNRYSQRLANEAHEQNIVVFAAARWDQDALESSKLGGGLFTYALVEGVGGKARDKAGEVRAESLRDYVRARVGELAKPMGFEQEPQFIKGRDAENYLLSRGE